MARAESLEPIPAMTDPQGKYWKQPARKEIKIDSGNAIMLQATFDKLEKYSCSLPTGCYPGKMWSRHDGAHDPKCPPEQRTWMLCWYGPVVNGQCAIERRLIKIVEAL